MPAYAYATVMKSLPSCLAKCWIRRNKIRREHKSARVWAAIRTPQHGCWDELRLLDLAKGQRWCTSYNRAVPLYFIADVQYLHIWLPRSPTSGKVNRGSRNSSWTRACGHFRYFYANHVENAATILVCPNLKAKSITSVKTNALVTTGLHNRSRDESQGQICIKKKKIPKVFYAFAFLYTIHKCPFKT